MGALKKINWQWIVIAVVLFTRNVSAFGTIVGSMGQNAEHERITRNAMACPPGVKSDGSCFEPKSLDNLAGSSGTFGAVGSPDGSGSVAVGAAHCDSADFMDVPGYPRSRIQATAELQTCVNYLRDRMNEGINNAADILTDKDVIDESEVDDLTCTFGPIPNTPGDAKCEALEGFGRALHGVQDFYSHSNWVDSPDAASMITITNPPGLGLGGLVPFLDLRVTAPVSPPLNLSTGCFALVAQGTFCKDRITHDSLNKDTGTIAVPGGGSAGTTPRGRVNDNFQKAVAGAISDTTRLWRSFRDQLKRRYGDKKGNKIICAMTHDDPVKDCQGRLIAIVVDSSGSNQITDPGNIRISAAQAFNELLISDADAGPTGKADKVAVVDFDNSAKLLYALGDPEGANGVFGQIDSDGGTCIGCGIQLGIDQLTSDPDNDPKDRGGVVVFTDGDDGNPSVQVAQLARARALGIRIAYGFLSPPPNPLPRRALKKRNLVKRAPPLSILQQILATGGVYAEINSALAQQNFITLVNSIGPTNLDGAGDPITLLPELEVGGVISSDKPRYFIYNARANEVFTITVTSRGSQPLTAVLRNIRTGNILSDQTIDGTSATVITIDLTFTVDEELELEIVTGPGIVDAVFFVGLETNAPTIPPTPTPSTTISASSTEPPTTDPTLPPPSSSDPPTTDSSSGFPSVSPNATATGLPTNIITTTITFPVGTGISQTSITVTFTNSDVNTGTSEPSGTGGASGTNLPGGTSTEDPPFPTNTANPTLQPTVTTIHHTTSFTSHHVTIHTVTLPGGSTSCYTETGIQAYTHVVTRIITCPGSCGPKGQGKTPHGPKTTFGHGGEVPGVNTSKHHEPPSQQTSTPPNYDGKDCGKPSETLGHHEPSDPKYTGCGRSGCKPPAGTPPVRIPPVVPPLGCGDNKGGNCTVTPTTPSPSFATGAAAALGGDKYGVVGTVVGVAVFAVGLIAL